MSVRIPKDFDFDAELDISDLFKKMNSKKKVRDESLEDVIERMAEEVDLDEFFG